VAIGVSLLYGLPVQPKPDSFASMERNKWYAVDTDTKWTWDKLMKDEVVDSVHWVLLAGIFDKKPTWEDYPDLGNIKLRVVSFESEP